MTTSDTTNRAEVTALRAEVTALRAEVDQLRAMLAGFTLELRTQSIVLTDGVRRTEITPAHIRLTAAAEDGAGGSSVRLGAYGSAADIIVAEHLDDPTDTDPRLSVTLYAGSETIPGEAYTCLKAGAVEELVGITLEPVESGEGS